MGKPSRILDVPGSYLEFDQHGKVLQGYLAQGAFEAMETYDALERSPGLRSQFCMPNDGQETRQSRRRKEGRPLKSTIVGMIPNSGHSI